MQILLILAIIINLSCNHIDKPSNIIIANKQLALTIDDLPCASPIRNRKQVIQINQQILTSLKDRNIHAIGFVNEVHLYERDSVSSNSIEVLRLWTKEGMDLGNHTYSHRSYHKMSFEAFTQEILKGEKITRQLLKKFDRHLKYFRHPYLDTGETLEKKEKLDTFLRENGYQIAPVTIDTDDWIFSIAIEKAIRRNDLNRIDKLRDEYINHVLSKFAYYEKKSVELFGRNIKHVLLIHANLINKLYLDKLLDALLERGYKFIKLSEALKDNAYKSEDNYLGDKGISWIERWLITENIDQMTEILSKSPRPPKNVLEYSDVMIY